MIVSILLPAVVLLAVVLLSRRGRKVPPGLRLVPGPKGLPLIGNTLQVPQSRPEKQFMQWAKEYGELFRVQIGWNDWIFVNSDVAVKEIFDKHSAITSSRPRLPISSELVSGGYRFLFMPYNEYWRRLRTIVHQLLTPKMSATFKPSQVFESKQLVYDILHHNEDFTSFYQHCRRYTTSVIMASTYGRRVPTWENEDIKEIYSIVEEFGDVTRPGTWLAETIPPLADLPTWMQWWRPAALKYQDHQTRVWMKYWNKLQDQIRDGTAPECFVKQLAESNYQEKGISEIQAAYLSGSMIEAGSETTSATLNSAILHLIANPRCIIRAHQELVSVVPPGRGPTFDDEPRLPYIRAIVKEILRVKPVASIGSPHCTTDDLIYKDMFIPKGTVITIFQWAIHADPTRWEEPEKFMPERYLDYPLKSGDYAAMPDPRQRDHFSFGAGRRICPGLHLSENSLFITLARILWAFNIEAVGVVDTDAYQDGSITSAKVFKAKFTPWDEEKRRLVDEEWERAQREGYSIGGIVVK